MITIFLGLWSLKPSFTSIFLDILFIQLPWSALNNLCINSSCSKVCRISSIFSKRSNPKFVPFILISEKGYSNFIWTFFVCLFFSLLLMSLRLPLNSQYYHHDRELFQLLNLLISVGLQTYLLKLNHLILVFSLMIQLLQRSRVPCIKLYLSTMEIPLAVLFMRQWTDYLVLLSLSKGFSYMLEHI